MSDQPEFPPEDFGRRAILMGICSNAVALRAVLDDCRREGVDDIVCLGNICGFGPDPVECVDLVREHCRWSLCGYHDFHLLNVRPDFNASAKRAFYWEQRKLQPNWFSSIRTRRRWKWFAELAPSRKIGSTLYVSASPRDPLYEYIFAADEPAKWKEYFNVVEEVCFSGGAGVGRPGFITDRLKWIAPDQLKNMSFKLSVKLKFLIVVGNVGRSLDGNLDASYVIYDKRKQIVQFRRVKYDMKAAQQRFMKMPHVDERMWQRMERGE